MKKLLILNLSILFLCTGIQMYSEGCKDIVLGNMMDLFDYPYDGATLMIKYYNGPREEGLRRAFGQMMLDGTEQIVKRGTGWHQLPCDAEVFDAKYGRSGILYRLKDVTDIFKQKMK